MHITSKTKIVPIVFIDGSQVIIKAFAPEQKAFVHLYDSEYHKKGELSSPINDDIKLNNYVVINCLADIDKAAKLAMSARPALTDEFPAAVIRYNPAFPHHDVMYWHPVSCIGRIQPYINCGWLDVPVNGAFLHPDCDTDRTRIFHSPVDAIAAAYDQTVKFIGNLRREVKAEEEKVQKQIAEKNALIAQLNKAQEV